MSVVNNIYTAAVDEVAARSIAHPEHTDDFGFSSRRVLNNHGVSRHLVGAPDDYCVKRTPADTYVRFEGDLHAAMGAVVPTVINSRRMYTQSFTCSEQSRALYVFVPWSKYDKWTDKRQSVKLVIVRAVGEIFAGGRMLANAVACLTQQSSGAPTRCLVTRL